MSTRKIAEGSVLALLAGGLAAFLLISGRSDFFFLVLSLGALLVGFAWKLTFPRRASIFLPVSFYLFCCSLPYVALALLGLWPESLLIIVPAILVLILAAWVTQKWMKAVIVSFLSSALILALLSQKVMSPYWPGHCAGPYDAVIKYGGEVDPARRPYAVQCSPDGRGVFVTYPREARIARLSTSGGVYTRPEDLLAAASVLGVDEGIGAVLAPLTRQSRLAWIQPRDNSIESPVGLGKKKCSQPVAVRWDKIRDRVLLLCGEDGSTSFLHRLYPDPVASVSGFGRRVSTMEVNQVLERAYITDLLGAKMLEIDLETMEPLREVPVGFCASGLAVSPDGLTLYVGRPLSDALDVYNATTMKRVLTKKAGYGVNLLRISKDGRYLFIISSFRGLIRIEDLIDNGKYGPFEVGRPILDVSYCEESERLFFTTPCGVRQLDMRLISK